MKSGEIAIQFECRDVEAESIAALVASIAVADDGNDQQILDAFGYLYRLGWTNGARDIIEQGRR
jgi:hypothetical protein